MIKASDYIETKVETVQEFYDSVTLAYYMRRKGSDDEWMWAGTVEYCPYGGAELVDSPMWRNEEC